MRLNIINGLLSMLPGTGLMDIAPTHCPFVITRKISGQSQIITLIVLHYNQTICRMPSFFSIPTTRKYLETMRQIKRHTLHLSEDKHEIFLPFLQINIFMDKPQNMRNSQGERGKSLIRQHLQMVLSC